MTADDRRTRGPLHYRVVNRFSWSCREWLLGKPQEVQVCGRAINSRAHATGHCRFKAGDLLEHYVGPEQEISAIPKVSISYVSSRSIPVGLFSECFHRQNCCPMYL